jgi:hypothetical protein
MENGNGEWLMGDGDGEVKTRGHAGAPKGIRGKRGPNRGGAHSIYRQDQGREKKVKLQNEPKFWRGANFVMG